MSNQIVTRLILLDVKDNATTPSVTRFGSDNNPITSIRWADFNFTLEGFIPDLRKFAEQIFEALPKTTPPVCEHCKRQVEIDNQNRASNPCKFIPPRCTKCGTRGPITLYVDPAREGPAEFLCPTCYKILMLIQKVDHAQ